MSSVKFVYALISDGRDLYTEQLCASSYSLRYYNPSAEILLITDNQTIRDIHEQYLDKLLSYISMQIVIDIPSQFNKVQRSRYLKTSIRNIVDGDYFFLDTDTIITCELPFRDIEENVLIGAVYDCHNPKIPAFGKEKRDLIRSLLNKKADNIDSYYNSGVMYVKDDPVVHEFYTMWHDLWKQSVAIGMHFDQPALGVVNKLFGNIITPLPFVYNVQVNLNSMLYLTNSRIIHLFFGSNLDYNLRNILSDYFNDIYLSIKRNQSIGDLEINKIIYLKDRLMPYVEQQGLFEARGLYQFACHAYKNSPVIFFFLRAFAYVLKKFCH